MPESTPGLGQYVQCELAFLSQNSWHPLYKLLIFPSESLSPFSAVISLKKSLICDKFGSPIIPNYQAFDNKHLIDRNQHLEAELLNLESKYNNLVLQFNVACSTIKSLEEQTIVKQKEAEAVNECQAVIDELKSNIFQLEEKERIYTSEIQDLRRSNANADQVAIRLNKELNNVKVKYEEDKIIKQKEHKAEVKWLKKDIGKLNSKIIKMEKIKDAATKLPNSVHTDSDTIMKVEEYDPTVVICSICSFIIPNYIPKYFMGHEINAACEKCYSPLDSSEAEDDVKCTEGDDVSESSYRENEDSLSDVTAPGKCSDVICKHSPQCVIRQPYPPPLPSITHIRNDRSKYHLHMMSRHGLPGHYGGHERCINAYSKNYGCESCIWFKWNGELYGLLDINPHEYKKYLDPDPTENTNSTN